MLEILQKVTAHNIWMARASIVQWTRSERDGQTSENKSLSDASNYGACWLYEKQIAEGPLSRPRHIPNEPLEQAIVSLLLPFLYLGDWLWTRNQVVESKISLICKLPVIKSIVLLRSSLDVVLLFASPWVSIARSFQQFLTVVPTNF